ncbi:hypothetical protein MAR_033455, partial [Mya arenaria]
ETVNDVCLTIKTYAQKYFSKKGLDHDACAQCYKEIVKTWNQEPGHFTNWKEFMEKVGENNIDKTLKHKNVYKDLIHLCERSKEFETMIPHVRERIVNCVKDHVYKYCHSFSEETGGVEASIVTEYEQQIRNYKRDIEKMINAINSDILRYSDVKSSFERFIAEGANIGKLMESICVQIVEIAHEVKRWISDDSAYPDKLQQDILFNTGYKDTLQEDVFKLQKRKHSLERSLERRSKVRKKTEKEYNIHRKEKKKRKDSIQTLQLKIERLEFQISQKTEHVEGTKTALSTKRTLTPRQEEDMHAKLAKNLREIDRLSEWMSVAKRQRTRLERESMHERLDNLDRKTTVMKHIRVLKMSPETLRKLYRRRREFYQEGQLTDACRYVAQEIDNDWKRLYACLPFQPSRDREKLSHDIELIDIYSARRDRTMEEQALKCLEKWRTFSRTSADVAQLIRGLRKLNKEDLADKVEMRFSTESVYG